MLFSSFVNANPDFVDKNPEKQDISINNLTKYYCVKAGNFLTRTCTEMVHECYRSHEWPKTFNTNYKLQVLDNCMTELLVFH